MLEVNDPPIVVTGGSVNLDFDEATLPGSGGKRSNKSKKIKNVKVVIDGATIYDGRPANADSVEIRVTYGNNNGGNP